MSVCLPVRLATDQQQVGNLKLMRAYGCVSLRLETLVPDINDVNGRGEVRIPIGHTGEVMRWLDDDNYSVAWHPLGGGPAGWTIWSEAELAAQALLSPPIVCSSCGLSRHAVMSSARLGGCIPDVAHCCAAEDVSLYYPRTPYDWERARMRWSR